MCASFLAMTFTWHCCWQDYAHARYCDPLCISIPVSGCWPSSSPLLTWNQRSLCSTVALANRLYSVPCNSIFIFFLLQWSLFTALEYCFLILGLRVTTHRMPDSIIFFPQEPQYLGLEHMVMKHRLSSFISLKCASSNCAAGRVDFVSTKHWFRSVFCGKVTCELLDYHRI